MDNYIDTYYEQEWNELTTPVIKNDNADEDQLLSNDVSVNKATKKERISSPVLTLQLILCLSILTILFLFKTFAFDLYSVVKNWYDSEVQSTLYFSGDFSDLDYSSLFSSTLDEL